MLFEFIRFLQRPVWTAQPEDADRYLAYQRKDLGRSHSTVHKKAVALGNFFDFLMVRFEGDIRALTGQLGGPAPAAAPPGHHDQHQTALGDAPLRQWAREHDSLRAIGRDNVHAAIAGKAALARSSMLSGLRSIFTVLKGRQLVFVNPTARIRVTEPGGPVPAPVDLSKLRELLNSDDPVKAALSALLAFHAVRICSYAR